MEEDQREREARERRAVEAAKRTQKAITYIDSDGCEVTALPSGHTLYNAADWW